MSGTIRENILFGAAFNSQRYERAIHFAQLDYDLERMPENEQSEVSENKSFFIRTSSLCKSK